MILCTRTLLPPPLPLHLLRSLLAVAKRLPVPTLSRMAIPRQSMQLTPTPPDPVRHQLLRGQAQRVPERSHAPYHARLLQYRYRPISHIQSAVLKVLQHPLLPPLRRRQGPKSRPHPRRREETILGVPSQPIRRQRAMWWTLYQHGRNPCKSPATGMRQAAAGLESYVYSPQSYQVVLPVVARKRGLDGQYEQADGSPKPKPESSPVKPVSILDKYCAIRIYIFFFCTGTRYIWI